MYIGQHYKHAEDNDNGNPDGCKMMAMPKKDLLGDFTNGARSR